MENTLNEKVQEARHIKECLKQRGVEFRDVIVTDREVKILGSNSPLPRTRYFIMRSLSVAFDHCLKHADETFTVTFKRSISLD